MRNIKKKVMEKLASFKKAYEDSFKSDVSFNSDSLSSFVLSNYESDLKKELGVAKINPMDLDVKIKDFDLNWRVSFDTRQWGIKGIYVTCPDQEVSLEIEVDYFDEDNDKDLDITLVKSLKIKDVDVELENKVDFNSDISPEKLDFSKKKFTLIF